MKLLVCLLFVSISPLLFAQEKEVTSNQVDKENLPIPDERNQLFYLQRDPDANTIVYVLNIENNKLNESIPVVAYWIRYEEQRQIEKLTLLQRKMAYGVSQKEIEPGIYELHLHAYKKLKIILSPHPQTGKYQALVKTEDYDIVLNRIFARINGGSFFKPNVEYFEISGRRLDNGAKVSYRYNLP